MRVALKESAHGVGLRTAQLECAEGLSLSPACFDELSSADDPFVPEKRPGERHVNDLLAVGGDHTTGVGSDSWKKTVLS